MNHKLWFLWPKISSKYNFLLYKQHFKTKVKNDAYGNIAIHNLWLYNL